MDITLFNFRTFWEANADEDYREDTIRMSIALMTFLKNNNLLVDIDPFNEDGSIKEDIIIRKSNVTDEGFQLFVKPVNNWWNALDRGTSPEKVTILENGLMWVDPVGLVKLRPSDPKAGSLSNVAVRCWYIREESRIKDNCKLSLKQRARNLSKQRNEARMLMKDRKAAIKLYQTDPMLTFKQLVAKKKKKGLEGNAIYEDIIESSRKSRESVNKKLLDGVDCAKLLAELGI